MLKITGNVGVNLATAKYINLDHFFNGPICIFVNGLFDWIRYTWQNKQFSFAFAFEKHNQTIQFTKLSM